MSTQFEIPTDAAPVVHSEPVAQKENPCGTIYKYEGGWAVTTHAGEHFIFPTLGTALADLKRKLVKMDEA